MIPPENEGRRSMKARKVLSKIFTAAALAAVLLAAIAVLDRDRASAFNPQPDPPAFGNVGITFGQTARLNVVNLDQEMRAEVELMFFDSQGNTLAQSREMIAPNHAAHLDLNGDLLREAGRTQVTAGWKLLTPLAQGRNGPPISASAEVFGNFDGSDRMGV